MPEARRGDEDRADRSALREILYPEFNGCAYQGNAAGSDSVLGGGKTAEQDAVLRPEVDIVDTCLALEL